MLRYVYQLVANCVCLAFTAEQLRSEGEQVVCFVFSLGINTLAVATNSSSCVLTFIQGKVCKGQRRQRQSKTFLSMWNSSGNIQYIL